VSLSTVGDPAIDNFWFYVSIFMPFLFIIQRCSWGLGFMGSAICRCGQHVRTRAKSGSQVQCPRCDTWLTVPEKVLDPDRVLEQKRFDQDPDILLQRTHVNEPAQTAPESNQPHQPVVNHRTRSATSSWVPLAFVLLVASLGGLLWAYWGLGGSDKKVASVDNSEAFKATDGKPLGWGQIDWQDHLEANPNGNQVEQIARKIAETGRLLDPGRFWEQLDVNGFEKKVLSPGGSFLAYQEKIPVKQILDGLKTFPIETLSKADAIASCKWDVMGVCPATESIEVLVRYFHEPLDLSDLIMSDAWISSLSQTLSAEEYFNVAKDLYARRNTSLAQMVATDKREGVQDQLCESIFTPYFGYMVLSLKISKGSILWNDVTAIPSEVQLSRACGAILQKDWHTFRKGATVEPLRVPSGWQAEGVIDVFGEYESPNDQAFGHELVFGETRPDGQAVSRIDRAIQGISPIRARDLISVAVSVTSNYGQLKEKVSAFQKNYPNDIGLDALLLSLWIKHDDSKRSGLTFDDFGVVFVDAADRLYARFKDPVLNDIKSRIYLSHALPRESDEQLSLAEEQGTTTAYFFKRRIELALQKNDKSQTLKYLSQFNTFWLSQPGVTLASDSRSEWNKFLKRWKK
jgi:hypothetical protein